MTVHDSDWWRGAIIYQVYPRSFCDSNGDGVGDLPGVTRKLDYIASLGVDAIWLSPFFLSPMRDFGYDVADQCVVDPSFGTMGDFDALVARAHALGIKVIIDQIWGHTSDQHRWFRDSLANRAGAHHDWYVWADPKPDGTPPNNWLSVFGGSAWSWEPRRRQYYLHHFLASQPTLNLRNESVVEALLAAGRFWLDRGVDGFRLDALDFLLHDPGLRDNPPRPPVNGQMPAKPFGLQHHCHDMVQRDVNGVLSRLRALADERPGTALLGEVSSQDGAFTRIARYTAAGEGLDMAYTLRPLRTGNVRDAVEEALAEIDGAGDDGWVCWAFSNHDVERAPSRWSSNPSPAFAQLLLTLLATLRGSVCLYQGEELGLTEARLALEDLRDPFGIAYFPEFRGRDGSRTPLPWRGDAPQAGFSDGTPWLPLPQEHLPLNVAAQEADPGSLLNRWRRLAAWRKSHPALRSGLLERLTLPAPLIGFIRADETERLLVIVNPGEHSVRLSLADHAVMRLVDGHGGASLMEGDSALLPSCGVFVAELRTVQRRARRTA